MATVMATVMAFGRYLDGSRLPLRFGNRVTFPLNLPGIGVAFPSSGEQFEECTDNFQFWRTVAGFFNGLPQPYLLGWLRCVISIQPMKHVTLNPKSESDCLAWGPDLNLKSFDLNEITLGGAIWRTFRAINLPNSICSRDLRGIIPLDPQRDTNRV